MEPARFEGFTSVPMTSLYDYSSSLRAWEFFGRARAARQNAPDL